MSNISKRRKEGSKAKIKSMGDHKEFLKRITKTLYYGELPTLPCLSLPVTEISCEVWSVSQRGRSLRRLHADAAAGLARSACVSPCALVLALLYLERLNACNPDYIAATAPADLFLVSLMVGNKFLQDDGEDDEVICSEWATSGDMELNQLKKLELEFLSAINWNVFVNEKSFEAGLRWLERNVALKQARLRGFFTYSDLAAAAGARGLAQLAAGLALALAALASTLALLTSALLLARLASSPSPLTHPASSPTPLTHPASSPIPLTHPTSTPLTHPASSPTHSNIITADTAPPPLGNATLVDAFFLDDPVERPTCCTTWSTYREDAEPKRNWFDGIVVYDWKSFEPWRSRTSVLNWLYQSSLVDPLQRWLEKIDEYADIVRRTVGPRQEAPAPNPCHEFGRHGAHSHCVRQWLNLSKLNALVASVSDR